MNSINSKPDLIYWLVKCTVSMYMKMGVLLNKNTKNI